MRVIYLVRSAQLLLTLRALFLLYSVNSFCQTTHHSMQACSNMISRIPLATPEQIAEHLRLKKERAAASSPAKITPDAPTTTAHAPSTTQSSTISPSTAGEAKNRTKREKGWILPDNGISEAQRKAAAAAVETKKEEEKKEGEKKTTAEVKTGADEKKEVKKEEAVTTQAPVHHEEKKVEQKSEHTEAKGSKVEVKTEEKKTGEQKPAPEVKTEAKADEKKKSEHPSDEKKDKKSVVKNDKPAQTSTEASKEPKKESKEYLGAEIHIPTAPNAHHEKAAEGKVDSAHLFSPSGDKHHTVKKDLKAHVQEPVKIEDTKKELPPKLAPVQSGFSDLAYSNAFLEKTRCVEVTAGDYFGRQASPYAQHLKGLVFAGPMLVVVAVYLVCTAVHALLSADTPSQFTGTLGCALHGCFWFVVMLTMTLVYDHWDANWKETSNNTFAPNFPPQWMVLMYLSGIMFLAAGIETWFLKRLHYDIVFERSYRCYEVIDDSEALPNERRLSRTNVY